MQERKLEIRRKGGLNIWSGWGGSTTVTTPNPTNLTQTWWVFTNEAIGPMISVFMRMMFQVWTSTQSWFSWPKSKVGWSTSGYFWLTLADERTSLEKYNFCCGLFQIQPWQQKQMWQPRENFSKAFPRLLNAVCYVLTLATCGFNGMYVFRKWDAKQ